MSICGSYDVTLDNEAAGTLTVSKQGTSHLFEFSGPERFQVSRLVCIGGGAVASIGIPAPKGQGMYLKKVFSSGTMAKIGIEKIDRCLIVPVDADLSSLTASSGTETPSSTSEPDAQSPARSESSGESREPAEQPSRESQRPPPPGSWQIAQEPWNIFSDERLRDECKKAGEALISSDGASSILLAYPYSPDSPFPIVSQFPSANMRNIRGKTYVVYRVQDGVII